MTDKLQTLLDINSIMKQRVEQRFAEIVQQREAVKSEINRIKTAIIKETDKSKDNDPMAAHILSKWEAAQRRKIRNLEIKDKQLLEVQSPIRAELSTIFVRDKTLKTRLRLQAQNNKLKTQKHQAERMQSVWIQNNL